MSTVNMRVCGLICWGLFGQSALDVVLECQCTGDTGDLISTLHFTCYQPSTTQQHAVLHCCAAHPMLLHVSLLVGCTASQHTPLLIDHIQILPLTRQPRRPLRHTPRTLRLTLLSSRTQHTTQIRIRRHRLHQQLRPRCRWRQADHNYVACFVSPHTAYLYHNTQHSKNTNSLFL